MSFEHNFDDLKEKAKNILEKIKKTTEKEKEDNEICKNGFRRTQSFKIPKSSVLINKIEKNKIETIQETKNDEPMNISNPNKLSKDRFNMFLKPIEDKNENKIKESIFLNNEKKIENGKSILKLNSDSILKNDNNEKILLLNETNNKNVETNEIEKEDNENSKNRFRRTQSFKVPSKINKTVDFITSQASTSSEELKKIFPINERRKQICFEKLNEYENENENEKQQTIFFINNKSRNNNEEINKSPLDDKKNGFIEPHFDDLEKDKNELNHLNRARPKPSRMYKKTVKININDETISDDQEANNVVETTEVTDNIEIDSKIDKIKKFGVTLPFMVSKNQLENVLKSRESRKSYKSVNTDLVDKNLKLINEQAAENEKSILKLNNDSKNDEDFVNKSNNKNVKFENEQIDNEDNLYSKFGIRRTKSFKEQKISDITNKITKQDFITNNTSLSEVGLKIKINAKEIIHHLSREKLIENDDKKQQSVINNDKNLTSKSELMNIETKNLPLIVKHINVKNNVTEIANKKNELVEKLTKIEKNNEKPIDILKLNKSSEDLFTKPIEDKNKNLINEDNNLKNNNKLWPRQKIDTEEYKAHANIQSNEINQNKSTITIVKDKMKSNENIEVTWKNKSSISPTKVLISSPLIDENKNNKECLECSRFNKTVVNFCKECSPKSFNIKNEPTTKNILNDKDNIKNKKKCLICNMLNNTSANFCKECGTKF